MTKIQIKDIEKSCQEIQRDSALFFPRTKNVYIVVMGKAGTYNLLCLSDKLLFFSSWATFEELVKNINEDMEPFQVIKKINLELEF